MFYWNVYSYYGGLHQTTKKTDMTNITRDDLTGYYLQNASAIYVFDSAGKKLRKGSAADIRDYKSTGEYSRIFMYSYLGTPRLLVAYE